MTPLTSRRLAGAALFLGLSLSLNAADPIELTLTPDSSYVSGCFPPCLCPIGIREGLSGTLTFRETESNPLFTLFDVEADLIAPGDPPLSLRGSGTYRIGGEVALTEELVLELSSNGQKPEKFQSGVVAEGGEFPGALAISISIGTRECFDTILEIRAKRSEGPKLPAFVRGDCNADGEINISDAISGLVYLFGGGPTPPCIDSCDANDDGRQDLSDAVATLTYLFLGGDPLPPPAGACGADPSADDLACLSYPPCAESCDDEVAAIAAETTLVGSCSAVVRLDFLTRRILAWQLICGKYARPTEDSAREQAKADTGYGSGVMLNPAEPEDAYVFYESPGDFGGASAVSARTGLSLFGGSIVWDGTGDITYPKEWRKPESLGTGCEPWPGDVPARGYDLRGGDKLPGEDVASALDVVRTTAVFEGMATSGYVFDAVVLLYPRSVGAFNPATAEWIVLVNGGWLE